MPSPKHAELTAPTGITLTGTLLHEKRTKVEDINFEVFDGQGRFSCGKSLRKKTSFALSGEGLSTLALPTVGDGAATSTDPHIDDSEIAEKSEGAAEFSLNAHYYENGVGDFA
jgi:hypothetical protein